MDQIKTGKFIAALRKELNLTQEQLGKQLGVTNKTVSRWENGHYMPDIELFAQLAELFSVTISELIAGERLTCTPPERIDSIIRDAVSCDRFSISEKIRFWKQKWLREHRGLLILLSLTAAALHTLIWFRLEALRPLAAAGLCIGGVAAYGILNNRMMSYVEHKVYDRT